MSRAIKFYEFKKKVGKKARTSSKIFGRLLFEEEIKQHCHHFSQQSQTTLPLLLSLQRKENLKKLHFEEVFLEN
jgi:hypothetical protein